MRLYHFTHADAPERVAQIDDGEKGVALAVDDSGVYVLTEAAPKAARAKGGAETR